jgi:hypothetical protein
LAHYGSIDRLIIESGHTNLRTTKDHYLGLATKEAGADFLESVPARYWREGGPFFKSFSISGDAS